MSGRWEGGLVRVVRCGRVSGQACEATMDMYVLRNVLVRIVLALATACLTTSTGYGLPCYGLQGQGTPGSRALANTHSCTSSSASACSSPTTPSPFCDCRCSRARCSTSSAFCDCRDSRTRCSTPSTFCSCRDSRNRCCSQVPWRHALCHRSSQLGQ